jgi:hypothetical protein|tara:strand:- start:1226 stop:1549 length:324 start_codon:yes stop_codon:yes gene_type:complete
MAFASNKNAYGICDITGFRYKLKDMKMTWNGLLVGPDQWSPKEPQLSPRPKAADPEALKISRPDQAADGEDGTFFQVYTNQGLGKLATSLQTFAISCTVGTVEVTIT